MQRPSYILCVLIGTFAIGSWIDINGLWVQTPLLVQSAPEKWDLPSQLVIIIQIANIGPLVYLLLKRLFKGKIREAPVIYIILVIGCLSCVFLALFWKETAYFLGAIRSVPLLVLTFFLATVDCTSSLVFLPYLASYASAYMTTLYIGEGFSGLLPGIMALIQGIGGETQCVNMTDANGTWSIVPVSPEPLFSVQGFFFFLAAMLLVSFLAFLIVDCHPKLQVYKINTSYSNVANYAFEQTNSSSIEIVDSNRSILPTSEIAPGPRKNACIMLLIMVTWINALTNGFLPSLQSYSMMPYGNVSYHLGVTLSNIVNPLACFITFFWKVKSIKLLSFMTLIGTILSVYMTYLAFSSPTPPLADDIGGRIIMVAAVVSLTAIFSYGKACVALELQKVGKKYLTLCGLFTQVGSSIGAITSFLIVNVFHLLKQAPSCKL